MEQTKDMTENEARIGSVKIADDVVASIAAIAATEVEGVSAMAGNLPKEILHKVGVKNQTKGTRAVVTGKTVKIDLAIVIDYGFNIPTTCQYVQNRVIGAIENMTGLTVADVNIKIAGISVGNK